MTIAIISMIRDNWGGSEELWASMADHALKEGHTVTHLSYKSPEVHAKTMGLINNGLIEFTRPSYIEKSNNLLLQLTGKGVNFLRKKINFSFEKIFDKKPDVVIYNGTCYSIAGEKDLMEQLGKSGAAFYIIGHFNDERGRGGIADFSAQKVINAYNRSKKVFFISNRSLQNARRQLATTIPNGLVLRNPVNISATTIIPFPKSMTIQLAMVGNLITVHKGQDIALEVLSQPRWKERNWHLNIYGSGADEKYLRQLVAGFGLENNVSFHGKVSDIRAVWGKNHLLLMPSHMEGMPLAVVEAMICGRPCVGTDVGGIAEWIEEGKSGFIAEAPTVHSFGNSLEKAWSRLNDWESIGRNAHERAMSLYDPEPGKTLLNLISQEA